MGGDLTPLIGMYVIEARVRQAWPLLTLLDHSGDVERRLYFDTDLAFGSESRRWSGSGRPRTYLGLSRLVNCWIEGVSITTDGDLRLRFDDGSELAVRRDGIAKTTGDAWWLSGRIE